MKPEGIDPVKLRSILNKHHREKWGLIPVLQKIQETFGYIPPESIVTVADALQIYPSQVQGVVTFYAGLSTEPKGRVVVRVCRGTACHVKGGRSIDYQFTLETVACLGACFLAPTMMVNKAYYGRLSPPKVSSILSQYGKRETE